MSRLSRGLLVIGAVLYVGGKIAIHFEAADFRQRIHPGVRGFSLQFLHDMESLYRAEWMGRILMASSLVPFGIAAWKIYHETQSQPSHRPPRQPGGGGF
jgi:hypothetical protein